MCGIFGSFNFNRRRVPDHVARTMANAIAHRGPDAEGFFSDEQALVGNRRLSILDLSDRSNQPLYSDDRSIVVVQNGEIYNFIELREELIAAGCVFRTDGDTEVILRAFETWGADFVTRLNGMFAIAIYEQANARVWLYRDRLGVKPLYLAGGGESGRTWFASEIKALCETLEHAVPNYDALAQFFALNYIPQPHTAFAGVRHVPPGTRVCLSAAGEQHTRYWDLAATVAEPEMMPSEAKAGLICLLDDAVRIRLRSDASFGAFLSGGLDSSSVVGLMSLYRTEPIRTFSIGFDEERFDETYFARLAARRFGTMHATRIMRSDVVTMWPTMIWHCDQPHGDVSFMPMLEVSRLAAADVKMVLTGDGGDELFGGYEKYLEIFPRSSGHAAPEGWERAYVRQSGLLQGTEPQQLLRGPLRDAFMDLNPYRELEDSLYAAQAQDPINRLLVAETTTLLPGNNLVKPDRMAMAHSLEVRSPFLDYRLAEFAFQVPGRMKLHEGETKWIYKRAVEPLLGRELTYRKKQMFTVPIGEWFRQELAHFCRSMLLDGRLESRGIIDVDAVRRMLADHIQGTHNFTRQLRALISVEIWFRLFIDKDRSLLSPIANQTLEVTS